jgi:hypothetical protein
MKGMITYDQMPQGVKADERCWPHKRWFTIVIVSVLVITILIVWQYFQPQHANIFRSVAYIFVLVIISFLLWYVYFSSRHCSRSAADISNDLKGYDNPIPPAEITCKAPHSNRRVVLEFVVIMVVAWFTFTIFVVVISIRDYMAPNESQAVEIEKLMNKGESTLANLASLTWGAAYFTAGTLATAGSGNTTAGINFWGRLAFITMTLFVIMLIPILGQYILSNHQLSVVLQASIPKSETTQVLGIFFLRI